MKKKIGYKYKKGTKYASGTQTLNPNADPTTQYQTNRDQSTGAMQFNNAQQAELNKGIVQQQYQDKTNQVLGQYQDKQASKKATDASIASAMGSIPGVGTLAAAGYGLGTSAGDSFNQKSYENTLATGKSDTTNKAIASVLTPTSSKLMNAQSGSDVVNAFIPFLNVNSTTQAKNEQAAVAAKKQQEYVDKQLSQYGAVDSNVQAKQIKKGAYKIKTRDIETEGREPIFSPKKKDGTRDLLYYNPSAPTHEEGGVPAKVVPKSQYQMKKGNGKLTIPEGAAIVTAKGDMNKKAVTAYKKGDYKTLNKIIDKMPNDNKKSKVDGDEYLTDLEGNGLGDTKSTPSAELEDSVFSNNKSNVKFAGSPTTETPVAKTSGSKFGNTASSIVGLAPTIYNLGQGLFGKTTKTNRRLYEPELLKYKDTSTGLRKDAEEEFRVNQNNIRNATGGSGASYLSNQAMAQAQRYKTKEAINRGETDRMFDVANTNVGTRNQAKMTNLGLSNQYDEMDLANKAKKSEYLGKGLEGLSQAAQMSQLNKNRAKSDDTRLNLMKTGNYTIDKDGNITPKAKKGLKNIKYKMKQ